MSLRIKYEWLRYELPHILKHEKWRCIIGIHYFSGHDTWDYDYITDCKWCGKDGDPWKWRILDRWYRTKVGKAYITIIERWFSWRHPYGEIDGKEMCLRHNKEWGRE